MRNIKDQWQQIIPQNIVNIYNLRLFVKDYQNCLKVKSRLPDNILQVILLSKTGRLSEDGDKKFITMANSFVNLDDLTIDLIDSINPFQHAFEVISKKVGVDIFRVIQDTIAGSRIGMTDEDALALVPQIKQFVIAHNGEYPSLNSSDKNEKLLAQAQAYLTARRSQMQRVENSGEKGNA